MNLVYLLHFLNALLMVIAFFGVANFPQMRSIKIKFRIIEIALTYAAVTAVLFLGNQLHILLAPEQEAVSPFIHSTIHLFTNTAPIVGIFMFVAYRRIRIWSLSAFFAVFSIIILSLSSSISTIILNYGTMDFILQIAGEDRNAHMWVTVFINHLTFAVTTFAFAYASGAFLKRKFLILDEQIKRSLALYLFFAAALVNVVFGSISFYQHNILFSRDQYDDYAQLSEQYSTREGSGARRAAQLERYFAEYRAIGRPDSEEQTVRQPVRIRDREQIQVSDRDRERMQVRDRDREQMQGGAEGVYEGRQDMHLTIIRDGETIQDVIESDGNGAMISPRLLPGEPQPLMQAPAQQLLIIYSAVILILMTAMVLFIAHNLSMKFNLRQKEDRILALRENTENLESLSLEARAFRHDHENLMLSFHEHLLNKDIDGALDYYKNYMVSFYKSVENINKGLDILGKVNTPELKGILSHKLPSAQRAGVKVVIDISDDIRSIPDKHLLDVCRIVGILLDNAVEACRDAENPQLHLGILNKSPATLIVLKNNFLNPPDMGKLSDKGYTTKESSRGLGLYTANQIIQSNPNLSLTPQIKKENFVQLLTILP